MFMRIALAVVLIILGIIIFSIPALIFFFIIAFSKCIKDIGENW